MKIIKRSGSEVAFDISKIVAAVEKANKEVVETERLTIDQIKEIAKKGHIYDVAYPDHCLIRSWSIKFFSVPVSNRL